MSNRLMLRRIGGVTPNPFQNAILAYSLRDLGLGVSNLVRVRRSSDNTEQDFTETEITDGTLTTFVGTGNDGFVATWYNQLGTNNLTQSIGTQQPKIVSNGNLILLNGQPALDFDGVDDFFSPIQQTPTLPETSFVWVGEFNSSGGNILFSGFNQNYQVWVSANINLNFINGSNLFLGSKSDIETQAILWGDVVGASSNFYLNDNLLQTGNPGNLGFDGLTFGGNESSGSSPAKQLVNEFIVYPVNNNVKRNSVITNINNYYNIY